jgi:hypothetical protein
MEGPIYEVKSTGSFYVVYDADDGNIVHTHEYIALPGAEYPPESEIEAEALEMAARATGKEVERMGTLRVRKDDLRVGAEYAVDLGEERLVEQQPPT